jgi:probable addiction module antidote protein
MKEGKNELYNIRAIHSRHLQDQKVAAEYLSAALDDGDPAVILMALRNIAEAQEGGVSSLAKRSSLGRESMYKMLSKTGNPKLSSFTKVIQALGLKLKVEQDIHHGTT